MPARDGKLGFVLFAIYLAFYGGFVALNAFWPTAMEMTPLAGVNLAIWYGFALIVVALVLALIYGLFGTTPPENAPPEKGGKP